MSSIAAPTPNLSASHSHRRPKGGRRGSSVGATTPHSHRRPKGGGQGSLIDVIAVIVLIASGIALAWPWASAQWNTYQSNQRVLTQNSAVDALTPEQNAAEFQKAVDYNNSLTGDPVKDPFVPGSGAAVPSQDAYTNALNVNGDGIMGSVDIDMIGVHLPIAHGTEEGTLQHNAGHIRQTSLPIGGADTHSVIAAHSGLVSAEMFTRLDEMQVGDTFEIHVLGETHVYQVDQVVTVLPEDLSKIAIEPGRDLVTLMTCTPYGINTHRLLVRGTRIDAKDAPAAQRTSFGIEHMVRLAGLALATLFALLLLMLLRRRTQAKKSIPGQHLSA